MILSKLKNLGIRINGRRDFFRKKTKKVFKAKTLFWLTRWGSKRANIVYYILSLTCGGGENMEK
ncbi:Uncharacterised protein [Listeria fleischmannii subsp. coloradonensis]|nr:Uncharacterised protein [Listeria fleischmannii subsp. coloradonensis]